MKWVRLVRRCWDTSGEGRYPGQRWVLHVAEAVWGSYLGGGGTVFLLRRLELDGKVEMVLGYKWWWMASVEVRV